MKEQKTYYELNPSQEVVMLQCKYTLFKRVVNIISSIETKNNLNFDLMEKAYNLVVERNDCLRIRFKKQNKKLVQWFEEKLPYKTIPVISFNTKEEQEKFIDKLKKHAIKYKKGVTIEPYFIKTYDNKNMILLKVCHLILDIYGINIIYKDLIDVYEALLNQTELPECPTSFEEVVKKDLRRKNNKETDANNREFFTKLLNSKEEPYYAGLNGENNKLWQKQLAKNKRAMKMFFIRNDTKGYCLKIKKDIMDRVMEYCKQINQSPANVLFFASSVCASKINGNVKNMLPLELYNCRGSAHEKKCAGTKVQSLACYTTIDHDKSFEENFANFCLEQSKLYRHIGFSDQAFEMLLHKTYKSSMLETYYPLTFSFIPYTKPVDYTLNMYSNEKGALITYIAQLYDINSGEMDIAYDCQTKIVSEQNVIDYHKNYISLLKQITQNPKIILKDIKF